MRPALVRSSSDERVTRRDRTSFQPISSTAG
jgi:hypothetical protein